MLEKTRNKIGAGLRRAREDATANLCALLGFRYEGPDGTPDGGNPAAGGPSTRSGPLTFAAVLAGLAYLLARLT